MDEYQELQNKLKTDSLVMRIEDKTWDWAVKMTLEDYTLNPLEDDKDQMKQTLFIVYGILRSNFRFALKCYGGNIEKLKNLIELIMEDISDKHMPDASS